MAGGNCPETPRQKMIGMMYLFLTAMLALNVSAELLNAFILVDRSILQAKESVEAKNEELYRQFAEGALLNPRVEEFYEEALQVREKADFLVDYIQGIKLLLVHTADGPSYTVENYKSKNNTSVVGQLLLSEPSGRRRSDTLKNHINDYRELLSSLVEGDTALIARINTNLSTADPEPREGVQRSWEDSKFYYVPMAGSMAMLSQIQADVRNMEADVVRHLFMRVDEGTFRFNKIGPLVIPSSQHVMRGDTYRAEIMMAAYDDEFPPRVIFNGQELRTADGRGILEIPASRLGDNSWQAEISIMGPEGWTTPQQVGGQFHVMEPNVVVSPTKMNVFYEGVENPVEISAPGVPSERLRVNISNATYTRRGNEYIVQPNAGSAGREAVVTVTTEINGRMQNLGSRNFRINRVPNPVAKVGGVSEGAIARQVLLAQMGIVADMENFDFDLTFRVTQFRVSTVQRGFMVDQRSSNNMFTEEQKDLIRAATRGQRIIIDDIRAVGPDGRTRNLSSITLTID
ncbi:type IX secretion system motor protein PorM/GldM [Alkalitalea saponilacus]|uniref:Gliding motility-associated protein GldM n=1 Tax=Alkalitalea saponilacus TaxID=889453 RepID=A0A1T5HMC5_9BACT|nr:gliding motility protein GldM [Alkalitalea saponilacus]ASB49400.1 gliding motility protein GldM [Alkalitalea saponilacus]SKC21823.1 gliding motility-associated protein GldM [Alkalitalea saponilacus]